MNDKFVRMWKVPYYSGILLEETEESHEAMDLLNMELTNWIQWIYTSC